MPSLKLLAAIPLALCASSATAVSNSETAILAGGCFWGLEAVFEHVEGVTDVVSGYAGGKAKDANYAAVSSDRTGHAESVRIVFDPGKIRYVDLLKIYFSVAHDPTQVNRQGPDVGPSYRSAVFPQSALQMRQAAAFIAGLESSRRFTRPIATKIETGRFYPAEARHQDFARRHPDHRYIVVHDLPKVERLRALFPAHYRP